MGPGIFLICLIVVAFVLLAAFSNILRDEVDNIAAFVESAKGTKYQGKAFDELPRPFSLAKFQLGVWTAVIASTYCYQFFCREVVPGFNETALLLLGISAGTTVTANAIDKNQAANNLQQNKVAGDTTPAVVRHQNSISTGFFLWDIIADENGISLHRFQNLVWMVICLSVYIHSLVMNTNIDPTSHLPNLDMTLISLTGISSASYVGLKMGENK